MAQINRFLKKLSSRSWKEWLPMLVMAAGIPLAALVLFASGPATETVEEADYQWNFARIGVESLGEVFRNKQNGTLSLSSRGSGLKESWDGFTYAYETLKPGQMIQGRVSNLTAPNAPGALAGIAVRAGLRADDAHLFAGFNQHGDLAVSWRNQKSGPTEERVVEGLGSGKWLRLVRRDGAVFVYHSADKTQWEAVMGVDVSLGSLAYGGGALTSGDTDQNATAEILGLETVFGLGLSPVFVQDSGAQQGMALSGDWESVTASTKGVLVNDNYLRGNLDTGETSETSSPSGSDTGEENQESEAEEETSEVTVQVPRT